jgi:hypothetical protein
LAIAIANFRMLAAACGVSFKGRSMSEAFLCSNLVRTILVMAGP